MCQSINIKNKGYVPYVSGPIYEIPKVNSTILLLNKNESFFSVKKNVSFLKSRFHLQLLSLVFQLIYAC